MHHAAPAENVTTESQTTRLTRNTTTQRAAPKRVANSFGRSSNNKLLVDTSVVGRSQSRAVVRHSRAQITNQVLKTQRSLDHCRVDCRRRNREVENPRCASQVVNENEQVQAASATKRGKKFATKCRNRRSYIDASPPPPGGGGACGAVKSTTSVSSNYKVPKSTDANTCRRAH